LIGKDSVGGDGGGKKPMSHLLLDDDRSVESCFPADSTAQSLVKSAA
jgi:hypothetical protein